MKTPAFYSTRHLILAATLAAISPLTWAAGSINVSFSAEGLCDQLRLEVASDGLVYGRQINPSCHTGDYLVAGRKKSDGYTLFVAQATPGSNAGSIASLELSANGRKVEAYQMDGLNPPKLLPGYATTTWRETAAP